MADNTFLVKLGMNVQELVNGVNKANGALNNFKSSIAKVGIGLSAIQVGRFVLDVSRLAGEAEGVRAAFNKLPEASRLMRELKDATGGTVSELELMKRSVMASNFDISLKALPELLQFATIRARQTGQSVNYLVDSIVTGIGRKSKLILDNLGISAVQLTEALGGASAASSSIGDVADAVGKIAEKNLKQMGSLTDDASVKFDRMAASWENLKVSMGNMVNSSGLPDFFEKLANGMNSIGLVMDKGWEGAIANIQQLQNAINKINHANNGNGVFGPEAKKQIDIIRESAKRLGVEIKVLTEGATLATKVFMVKPSGIWLNGDETQKQIRNIMFLEEQIKLLNEEIKLTDKPTEIKRYSDEIKELQKEIDTLMGKISKIKLDFTGLIKNKPSTLPSEGKKAQKDILGPLAENMFKGMDADSKTLQEITAKVNEARDAFEKMGIFTAKGLKQSEEAFSAFLKNKKLDEFIAKIQVIKDHESDMVQMAATFGNDLGVAFGDVITGAKTFAQAMAEMASSVIDSLERVVMANMMANASKFGLPGILLAATGFGVVKSLFKNIGKSSRSTNVTPSYSYGGRGQMHFEAKVEGRALKFVLAETGRNDSRVSTIG